MDPELLALLMGQQAVPMSTASDMPGSYQPQPYGNYGAGAAQDPIEALKAQIFAPPPEQQTDVRYRDLGRGGKIGLILKALGDVANVLQRQSAKGARTFAPSSYTQQFLAGEHQKLAEKNAFSSRADQLKRAKMLHELDVMEKAAAERRHVEREAIKRAMDEATSLQEAQAVAARARVKNASGMNRSELNQAVAEQGQFEDAAKAANAAADNARADEQLGLSRAAGDRAAAATDMERPDKVAARQYETDQRTNLRKAMLGIGEIKSAIRNGTTVPRFGKPADMRPSEIRAEFEAFGHEIGLDEEHMKTLLAQVDKELVAGKGEQVNAAFPLSIPQRP